MVRLIISFGLALVGHFYLLQFSFGIDTPTPPQLISDSSVSVSLNQYFEKTSDISKKESPILPPQKRTEQPVSTQKTPTPTPKPKAKPKQKTEPKKKTIKPTVQKIRKRLKPPEPIQISETKPVIEEKKVEEVPRQSTSREQTRTAVAQAVNKAANPTAPAKATNTETKNRKKSAKSSSVVEARPLYQFNPKPAYPNLARRRGWEGMVLLLVEVTEGGEVALVRLHKSCGHKILDKSALRAVKTWRFLAGTRNGKRTKSTVIIPVHFRLQNS